MTMLIWMKLLLLKYHKRKTEQAKTSSYLDSLEGYGDDTDVKVDARKEDATNNTVSGYNLN